MPDMAARWSSMSQPPMFLKARASGPEHQALLCLIATFVETPLVSPRS